MYTEQNRRTTLSAIEDQRALLPKGCRVAGAARQARRLKGYPAASDAKRVLSFSQQRLCFLESTSALAALFYTESSALRIKAALNIPGSRERS